MVRGSLAQGGFGKAAQRCECRAVSSEVCWIAYHRTRTPQGSELGEFAIVKLSISCAAAANDVNRLDWLRIEPRHNLRREVGTGEFVRMFGENASHIDGDVAVADNYCERTSSTGRRRGRQDGCCTSQRTLRADDAGHILARNFKPPIQRCARSQHNRVIERHQSSNEVAANFDVAEEADAITMRARDRRGADTALVL